MGDISDVMPTQSPTAQAIYDHYKKVGDAEPRREYLGASQIGHGCFRYLWYSFRWCGREEMDGRIYRLLERGDMEEYRVVNDLRAIGYEVHEIDAETGEQFAVSAVAGHSSGHLDGCVLGVLEAPKTWHALEIKTHNAKSFAYLKQHGVRKAKKAHYDQTQFYMHLTGMTRTLYVACNKDTDELYIERVRHDYQYAEKLIVFAERVIRAVNPVAGVRGTPEEKRLCTYCPFFELCTGQASVAIKCDVNCRTCAHSTPEMDGNARWTCSLYEKDLSLNDQRCGCPNHVFVSGLIMFAEPAEAGRNHDGSIWIEYRNPGGSVWRNGSDKKDGQYSSLELTRTPRGEVGQGIIHAVKKAFEGEIIKEVGANE